MARLVGGLDVDQHKADHQWVHSRRTIERFLIGFAGLNLGGLLYVLGRLLGGE